MKRQPDHQKREAKRSLWDMDGQRIKKKSRNKGKGRQKDKALIRAALTPRQEWEEEQEYLWDREVSEALYCHEYGPCEKCKEKD